MQRAGISLPMEIHGCALEFGIEIIRVDSERAVQNGSFLSETAQMTITEGNLLQREAIARIEINGALQTTHRLFLFALATLDVTLQLEHTGIVRQGLSGHVQLGERAVIIEVAAIEVLGACQMCFTCIRTEAKRRLDC